MSVSGHIYGVVLNDQAEHTALAPQFVRDPYGGPPVAPVLYLKPRAAIARGPVRVGSTERLSAGATLAMLMRRDLAHETGESALDCVGAVCLALDLSRRQPNYYRPAVAYRNADGYLVLGDWVAPTIPSEIATFVDDIHVHSWSLERLVRPAAALLAELSGFMTLRGGDVLMIGLPGDAPLVHAGQTIRIEAGELPALETRLTEQRP
jgi:5-oxopent-3-ene-1,2,5-tricarboxylate decarboxylase/2-hydroxyhepta-2,4-diene-1,7-dioate isomerase